MLAILRAWNCRHPQPTHFSEPSFNSHPPPRSAANRSVHAGFCSNSVDRCDIPPSLHDVCVQGVCARVCVCLFDMSVLAEAVCLQGHIKHTSHSLANNLHSFSALFSLDSISVSAFSVAYSLHLRPSIFLSLHRFPFSHQEKYPNFSTFWKSSASYTDFTSLFSFFKCLSALVCSSSSPSLYSSFRPSFTYSIDSHLKRYSFPLVSHCLPVLFPLYYHHHHHHLYSSTHLPVSLSSVLWPYLVSQLILHPSISCLKSGVPFFCRFCLTTFVSFKPQVSASVLYIYLPF